jgi:hypothetical protein
LFCAALTIAEIGQGIYRADTEETRSRRRAFLDELKATVPIQPVTQTTAEIIAPIGGEQAAQGINLPLAILSSAPPPWNSDTRSPAPTHEISTAFPACTLSNSESGWPVMPNLMLADNCASTLLSALLALEPEFAAGRVAVFRSGRLRVRKLRFSK